MDDLISRQAAIDALYSVDEYNAWSVKAIKDLPSAQPETHGKRTETHACDCVSRQAAVYAIGILLEQSEDDEHDKTWNNAIRSSINAVKHYLPSAQPERKNDDLILVKGSKGEWILVKGSNGKDYHKCSECLHTQEITGVKNYCAICGAEMVGKQNE